MTPEEEVAWKQKRAQYLRDDYAKNPRKYLNRCAKWKATHEEQNRKIRREGAKRTNRKSVIKLADNYIAKRLGIGVDLLRKHPELLEAHREVIRLKRKFSKPTQP